MLSTTVTCLGVIHGLEARQTAVGCVLGHRAGSNAQRLDGLLSGFRRVARARGGASPPERLSKAPPGFVEALRSTVALLPVSPRRAAALSTVRAIDDDIAELLWHFGVAEAPAPRR